MYVVSGLTTNPRGDREVKAIRKLESGTYSHAQIAESRLRPVERPVFKPGDKVLVEGHHGEFMSFEEGSEIVRIMLAPRKRSFASVGFMDIGPAVARMNYAILVIENYKRLMENCHGNQSSSRSKRSVRGEARGDRSDNWRPRR